MSFNQLPEELIAQVASKMSYADVRSLMKSSKRMNKIVKAFKMDRIKLKTLHCTIKNGRISKFKARREDNKLHFKNLKLSEEPLAVMRKVFDTCSSITEPKFVNLEINTAFLEIFPKFKNKIDNIIMWNGPINLNAEEFIAFCMKFKHMVVSELPMNKDLLTDDVFCKLVKITKFSYSAPFGGEVTSSRITDRTLNALYDENWLQDEFVIINVYNSITVKAIVEAIMIIKARKPEKLFWDLGFLNDNQREDAARLGVNGDPKFPPLNLFNRSIINQRNAETETHALWLAPGVLVAFNFAKNRRMP